MADVTGTSVGFGVIGARSFVAEAAVLPAILVASNAQLIAASSLSGDLDERWADCAVDTYDDVLNNPEVEAVYIPLPNHLHLEWIERCAAAGKHVLCEKPLALTATDAQRAADVCAEAGVMCAEAWMTPFHKRWLFALLHAGSGRLGTPTEVNSAFTFTIGPGNESNYRFNSAMGGGALNDVGIYCLSAAVKLWGAEPHQVRVAQSVMQGGVDVTTEYELVWSEGQRATGRCSFVEEENQSLEVVCDDGRVWIDVEPHTGGDPDPHFFWTEHESADLVESTQIKANDPYLTMVERFASAITGDRDWPRPMADVIAMTGLIERIRAEL